MFGENGEAEYAGEPVAVDRPYIPPEEFTRLHFKGTTLDELVEFGIKNKDYFDKNICKSDLDFYKPPALTEFKKDTPHLFEVNVKLSFLINAEHLRDTLDESSKILFIILTTYPDFSLFCIPASIIVNSTSTYSNRRSSRPTKSIRSCRQVQII